MMKQLPIALMLATATELSGQTRTQTSTHHPQWQANGTGDGTPKQRTLKRPALFDGKDDLEIKAL
jgi:hypothetical protein